MCPVKEKNAYVPYKTSTINGQPPERDYSKRTYPRCAPNCVCGGYEVVPIGLNTGASGSILCDLCRGKRNISWI